MKVYNSTYEEYLKTAVREEMNVQHQAELKRLQAQWQQQSALDFAVAHAVKHIQEQILTLRCPRCRQPFFDFDGCFSVRCSECQCSFCGWCLEDCGNDAHAHVANCEFSRRLGLAHSAYFGAGNAFIQAQRVRRKKLVVEYLRDEVLNKDVRVLVEQRIARDLHDHGIQL
jgi:hypothetical protein